jgi:hypothetical protein
LDGKNSSGLTNAAAWSFRDVDFKINRYETDTLGNKDPSKLVSSDLMMEMRYQSGSADYTCTKKKSGLTGLPAAFDAAVLVCPAATGNTEAAISKMEIDLQPLQSANMDVFEVEVIAVLRNGDLETRRLRKIFRLSSSGIVDESSSGFQVIVASKDISDRTEGDITDKHLHDDVEGLSTLLIVVLVAACFTAVGIGFYLSPFYTTCTNMCKGKPEGTPVENKSLVDRGKEAAPSGFKNLRY